MASTELLTAIMALLLDVGARQRATLAKMIVAVWLAGSMTITSLARAAAIRFQQQPRTLHKAVDRALGSVAIDPMKLDRSHARRVLQGRRVVRVAIDYRLVESAKRFDEGVARGGVRRPGTVVAHTIVRRCGEVARDRGLARQLSTSGRRPRSHSTFSLGIFHAEASSQILREAIGIMPTQAFSRAA
jgi:hypothetical protein